jgi:thiamine-phosphate pyrophosphorylase
LPALLAFTDPARTPDVEALARSLRPGSALVYRTFGAADAKVVAHRLRSILHARGVLLLIGQDVGLARHVGADGVHLPERLAHQAGPIRRGRPDWLVTCAAHSARAGRGSEANAVVVSAVFPSRSASASAPIGPVRLATIVRTIDRPVYALGGINAQNATRLRMSGVIGIAAIDGIRT